MRGVTLEMASSLCNCNLSLRLRLRPPAKKAVAAGAIPIRPLVILRIRPHFFSATTISVIPKAIQSHNHVYPHPIPQFAAAETEKFKTGLLKKLSKEKETFGNDLRMVVEVCAEIFDEFLRKDYGGPGTLLIEPFTDMMLALKEKNLAGASLAARASLLWAQNHVDQDWENWNSKMQE